MNWYKLYIKRISDILVALYVLLISLPLLIVVAMLISLYFKNNPFFTQPRPGRKGRIFRIIKFRSMWPPEALQNGKSRQRIPRLGRFLRACSIDELPQLINVVKGDMSLIGPRPLLPDYLDYYTPFQARRHGCRPGMTGWAQVNGRNQLSWEEKFRLDVYYVDHISWRLDLKILRMTLIRVLQRQGINQNETTTMAPFRDSGAQTTNDYA